jgi:hypothetical protein
LFFLGDVGDVPPDGQPDQLHPEVSQGRERLGKDAVIEHHEHPVDAAAGLDDGVDEVDLGAPVGGHVLHQQDMAAFRHLALDLGHAGEPLGLLAHVEHGQAHLLRNPGGVGNASGLAPGHGLDGLVGRRGGNGLGGIADHAGTFGGEGNQFPAIDIDGAGPARGEDIGILRPEVHGAGV